jgi:tRNA pseudouridine32 synthase / 23S rRNA pseudouridine746 synthase
LKLPLPIRDGVSPSKQYLPAGNWHSMPEFLQQYFPDVGMATWLERMQRGEVVYADGVCVMPAHEYRAGAVIYYYREVEGESAVPFEEIVLFQDAHLLVVDKPHFLPVTPSGQYLHETLLVRLKQKLQLEHLTPIHRLDRETAGVILFSHNPASRGDYQSLFHKREMSKVYEALAATLPEQKFPLTYRSRMVKGEPFFRMQEEAGAANSETHIEMLENRGKVALYRLRPLTGKNISCACIWLHWASPSLTMAFIPACCLRKVMIFQDLCSCWRALSPLKILIRGRIVILKVAGCWESQGQNVRICPLVII